MLKFMNFLQNFICQPKTPPTGAGGLSNKQAIVYKGKTVTYAEIWKIIDDRAKIFSTISEKNILLNHKDELENLLNFLTIISIGKVGIFVGKHLKKNELEILRNENKAFIIDENTLNLQLTLTRNIQQITYHQSPNTQFLGVLTSGTTSTPKLIFKDYQSWFSAFPHQSKVFGIGENDRLFVCDALSYSANLNAVLHMLWLGGTVVLTSLNTANNWEQQIEKEAVTSIFMVPSHYRLLKNIGKNSVKSIVSAGEKLDPETAKKLLNFAPNALLTEYYGSAELGHITYHQGQAIIDNPLSVGKPFPEVKIKIENEQIYVDSPYISPDYRNNKTNFDLGYFIDNQLILMGRAGRMFNRRGLNIFAEEIENHAKKLPFIIEATAIGILQEDNSHEIFLAYTCSDGFQNNINEKAIFSYLAKHLQATKIPHRIQEFDNLPRTDFGKIDYKALARIFEEEIFV
jgi:long-chain acyl-CoA synthetase